MPSNPHDAYKSTQVETASREQILLMLYDGCIKYMEQARDTMAEEQFERSHQKLIKAQDIVTELMASLEMDVGGQIAEDLYNLYDYVLHNLVQANVEKNVNRIESVLPVMRDLFDTWTEVIEEKGMTLEKARRQHRNRPSNDPPSGGVSSPSHASGSSSSPDSTGGSPPDPQTSLEETPYGDISIQG